MLKKAGIVVAAAAAGLLAVSPLAFADTEQHGLVNVNDVTAQVPVQACNNHIGVLDGAVGILGKAKNEQDNKGDCKQKNSSDND